MRRLLVAAVLVAAAFPSLAAHRVTVRQLEEKLANDFAKHRSDEEIGRRLAEFELTERLTPGTLQGFILKFNLSPHAAVALDLLADESALMDPPRAELPAAAAPDAETQQRMLAAAHDYVAGIISSVPNFFATRSTVRFDDTPQVLHANEWPVRAGFHPVGTRSRTVTVRDGQEVADTAGAASKAQSSPEMGLVSYGEFGPILARTLTDLGKGQISFSHWENSPLGVVAVFRYSVPKHGSHYAVHFCCILDREFEGAATYRNRNLPRYHSADPNPVETRGMKAYDATPGYHGTLAIEPSTGAIARMTLDAELDPGNPIMRASTVIEYGRMEIGDRTFVCPVRSLAMSAQQGPPPGDGEIIRSPVLSVNETTFTDYHRLGSSARIVAERGLSPAETPSAAAPQADDAPQR